MLNSWGLATNASSCFWSLAGFNLISFVVLLLLPGCCMPIIQIITLFLQGFCFPYFWEILKKKANCLRGIDTFSGRQLCKNGLLSIWRSLSLKRKSFLVRVDSFSEGPWHAEEQTRRQKSCITKTYLCNFDSLKPHFYIINLGFTGVYFIFLISDKNINCGFSLERL